MDYLVIKAGRPDGTDSSYLFYLRDRRDTHGGHDIHGDYLEVYRMASKGRVIGVYPRDSTGLMKAIERIKGQTPRGSHIEVTRNITHLDSSKILQIVQS